MRLSILFLAGALALGTHGTEAAAESASPLVDPSLFAAVEVAYADALVHPRRHVRRAAVRRHFRVRRTVRYGRPPGCDCRRRVYYYSPDYPDGLEHLPTHHEMPAPIVRRFYKARIVKHRRRPAALIRVKG